MEVYAQIKDLDWSSVGGDRQLSSLAEPAVADGQALSPYRRTGRLRRRLRPPAAVGAALANRDAGRFSVNFQPDGDLMFSPGVLWTAARHKIPLLSVMHNNRGYHQEVMHVQRMSNRRNRVAYLGKDLGPIGTRIENPDIDYAKLAQFVGRLFGRADHAIRTSWRRQSRRRCRRSRPASRRWSMC